MQIIPDYGLKPNYEKEKTIKRLSLSLILSILLHLLIIGLIFWLLHKSEIKPKPIIKSKISLDLTQFQTLPPKSAKPKSTPLPKTPMIKKELQKKLPPNPPKKSKKVISHKKIRKKTATNEGSLPKENNSSKRVTTMKIKPLHKKNKKSKKIQKRKKIKYTKVRHKKHIKRVSRAKKRSYFRKNIHPKGPNSRLIKRLYGSSYSRMSRAQREFIDKYLREILEISQRTLNYLGYPPEAAHFGEEGTNIVQFWLYPNGDMRGLRLKRRTGSSALDHQTIEVIKTAYMNYPRPKVKTKIIIYVRYRLY